MINLICSNECINDHIVDSFANSVRVALFKEFVASLKYLLNVIVVLLIETQPTIDDSGTLDHSLGLEAYTLQT